MKTKRLADLSLGSSAVVSAISGPNRVASLLVELGFVPGAAVEVLRRAPFGGPIQYRVHSVLISMRIAEAACITVTDAATWSDSVASVPVAELQLAAT